MENADHSAAQPNERNAHTPAGGGDTFPIGAWLRLDLPELPGFVGFTYVDQEAGPSAQGRVQKDGQEQAVIVRMPLGTWEVLSEVEVSRLGLPAVPSWVEEFYGPQPKPGALWGWWRQHPRLRGRFLPEYPDDLQVLVHDGGPRLTDRRPELVWVRVTGGEGDVFTGRVLNKPHQLVTVSEGSEIQFIAPAGGEHPLRVTGKYLAERSDWTIVPCNKCGLSELFDAPSDLLRVVFPNTPPGATTSMFSAFCGACGGLLLVKQRGGGPTEVISSDPPVRRKWWQFWK
jgi:hypothetical protein